MALAFRGSLTVRIGYPKDAGFEQAAFPGHVVSLAGIPSVPD